MLNLTTPRLELIPLQFEHLQALLNDPAEVGQSLGVHLAAGLVAPPVDRALQVKLLKIQAAPAGQLAWLTFWLIVLREEQIGAGMLGFKGAPDANGAVEIGYGIDPAYQNLGYMSEAVGALLAWAWRQLDCLRVTADTLPDNLGSQHVLHKNGFVQFQQTADAVWWKIERP